MLCESGKVVAVETDGVWVETLKSSVCGQCAAQKGCGQSLLSKFVAKDMTVIKAYYCEDSDRGFAPGDTVDIGIAENALVIATLISYMLPLLIMVVSAFFAGRFGGELLSVVGALLGLAVGALAVRWHAARHSNNAYFRPVVLAATSPRII